MLAGLALCSAAGCGAPDLRAMSPTVSKPTAEILLVGKPSHWYVSDAVTAAQSTGVIAGVSAVTAAQLPQALAKAVTNPHVGLVTVVQNGQIPASELAFANRHVTTRFDLVGAQAAAGSSVNVSQIVPSPQAVGYAAGWAAGDLATETSATSIGWLVGGTPQVPRAVVQAALAAAYTENPGVNMVPVSALPLTAGTGASAASSGSQTGSTAVSGSAAADIGTIPKILVVTRPLSSAEWRYASQNGIAIVSLCAQPEALAAVAPVVPGMDALQQSFRNFAKSRWSAGTLQSMSAPFVSLNSSQIPASISDSVDAMELSVQQGTLSLSSSWTMVPQTVRAAWGPIVQGAGA
ncbi:hypothetical protein JI721_00110 [Alicyclobacillus cycloheptanicus]|uniref:Uncharacterized protein n=1 Tax=Alicyclobacillus cycloheptanicus TaxID=1457 RepID=A0ABT9XGX7_9BACL|nr:hypothetical protein [Alicyclobacillus cycloheptanicus]MDQ0189289.1 hypothetical protein [Alicyclobacillus cycloheptanicus]WDM01347.1 hypothetical protein JI721_00110 [Alicyclobacillus cycloheptanicus]